MMRPRLSSAAHLSHRTLSRAKSLDASGGGVLSTFEAPPPRTPSMSYIALLCFEKCALRDVTHGVLPEPLKGEGIAANITTLTAGAQHVAQSHFHNYLYVSFIWHLHYIDDGWHAECRVRPNAMHGARS
jgi:hypothetical protein